MSIDTPFRHAGLDPASRRSWKDWIPVFTGMTILIEWSKSNGNDTNLIKFIMSNDISLERLREVVKDEEIYNNQFDSINHFLSQWFSFRLASVSSWAWLFRSYYCSSPYLDWAAGGLL